jgi:hypothetical protein
MAPAAVLFTSQVEGPWIYLVFKKNGGRNRHLYLSTHKKLQVIPKLVQDQKVFVMAPAAVLFTSQVERPWVYLYLKKNGGRYGHLYLSTYKKAQK